MTTMIRRNIMTTIAKRDIMTTMIRRNIMTTIAKRDIMTTMMVITAGQQQPQQQATQQQQPQQQATQQQQPQQQATQQQQPQQQATISLNVAESRMSKIPFFLQYRFTS
jgi:hypothetical protein